MHPSGHTVAQDAQPLQVSSNTCWANVYPFLFTSLAVSDITCSGHATTQRLQPLQRSVSTTIAPLIFAIGLVIIDYTCLYYRN